MDRNSEMRFAVKVSPGEDTGFPGGYLPTPRSPADITSQVARVEHCWASSASLLVCERYDKYRHNHFPF